MGAARPSVAPPLKCGDRNCLDSSTMLTNRSHDTLKEIIRQRTHRNSISNYDSVVGLLLGS